jgi:zinc and cadmium transporter
VDTLVYILLFTFIGSVASLMGGLLLLSREKLVMKFSHYLFSFAAGVLLGTAFFDLLPEAVEHGEEITAAALESGVEVSEFNVFLWTLIGILLFFLIVRFIHWFHHHDEHSPQEEKATVPLILLGDSFHNLIDGIVIATTFLVSIPLGIVTALAVAAHEIPQEIGDFAILLKRGVKKSKVLLFNVMSALVSLVGAVITYFIGESIDVYLPILLSLTAGFFIYIAASDLIPELHTKEKKSIIFMETIILFFGVWVVWFLVQILEGVH